MNKQHCVLACVFLFAAAPAWADENPTDVDKAAMQGNWELQSLDGKEISPKRTLEVKGTTFQFKADDKTVRNVVATLDATRQPKTIDLKEAGEDKPFLAIYKIDKDRLTFCVSVENAKPTDTRPTSFEGKPNQVLVTYTKVNS